MRGIPLLWTNQTNGDAGDQRGNWNEQKQDIWLLLQQCARLQNAHSCFCGHVYVMVHKGTHPVSELVCRKRSRHEREGEEVEIVACTVEVANMYLECRAFFDLGDINWV